MSDLERRALIVKAFKTGNWRDYEAFVSKIASNLKTELSDHSNVLRVDWIVGSIIHKDQQDVVAELVLCICTRGASETVKAAFPRSWQGVEVTQIDYADLRRSFLATWEKVFLELNGWSRKQTEVWARKWEDALNGERSALYHWGPIKTAVGALIKDEIKSRMGDKVQDFYNELRDVIECNEDRKSIPTQHPDLILNYDWNYVRRRRAELINKYSSEKV
jgi:hypothetical protein